MELSMGYILQVGKIKDSCGEEMIELDNLVTPALSIVVFSGMDDDEDIYMVGSPSTRTWKQCSWEDLTDLILPELGAVLAKEMVEVFGGEVSSELVAGSLSSALDEDEDGIANAGGEGMAVGFLDSHYFESSDAGQSFCMKYTLYDLDEQGWELNGDGELIVPNEDEPINVLDDPLSMLSFNDDDEYEPGFTVVVYGESDRQELKASVSEVAKAGLQIELSGGSVGAGYDPENVRPDSEVVKDIIDEIRSELDSIIDEDVDEFRGSGNFKVRPDYGPAKFYLDRIEGNYEMSLQNLVHHMMYQDGHYRKILNDRQYAEMESVVNDFPDTIYGPDSEEENYEQLQNVLDTIHYEMIANVGRELRTHGFEVDAFDEYLTED